MFVASLVPALLLAGGPASAAVQARTSPVDLALRVHAPASDANTDDGAEAVDTAAGPDEDAKADPVDATATSAPAMDSPAGEAPTSGPVEPAPVVPEAPPGGGGTPNADGDPFAGLLEGGEDDDPGRAPARPHADGSDPADRGIGRDEALRRYYKALYRPDNNPARPYFGVLGGGAMLGSSRSPVDARLGALDVEAGASWNFIGFAVGAGIAGGSVQVDERGDASAPFGVGGQANLSLGRLAYFGRGVLDLHVGYRATYYKVRAPASLELPSYMLPHGPELRLDAGFLVNRVREPRFFHRVGVSLAMQVIVGSAGVDLPVMAAPRFGLFYAFG